MNRPTGESGHCLRALGTRPPAEHCPSCLNTRTGKLAVTYYNPHVANEETEAQGGLQPPPLSCSLPGARCAELLNSEPAPCKTTPHRPGAPLRDPPPQALHRASSTHLFPFTRYFLISTLGRVCARPGDSQTEEIQLLPSPLAKPSLPSPLPPHPSYGKLVCLKSGQEKKNPRELEIIGEVGGRREPWPQIILESNFPSCRPENKTGSGKCKFSS